MQVLKVSFIGRYNRIIRQKVNVIPGHGDLNKG